MGSARSEAELAALARHLDVVSGELDAEIASFVTRDSAMQQRATILIGAASIVGALQVDSILEWAAVASLGLSLVAAVAGVVVVFPRTGEALGTAARVGDI